MSESSGGQNSTFGRNFQRFVNNALPFKSPAAIVNDVTKQNPKFKDFYKSGSIRSDLLNKHSVIAPKVPESGNPIGGFYADRAYTQMMYATLDADKARRLRDYRVMAAFAEVSNALDEICDEMLVPNEHGNITEIKFRNIYDVENVIKRQIEEEFRGFINLFELKDKGWEYTRSLLTDGELYFENIIHKDYPEQGILGVIGIPTHMIDPVYDSYQNLSVKAFLLRKLKHHKDEQEKDERMLQDKDFIPLDKNQVTYIDSGTWNEDRTFRVPFIENARRAYRQLTMIEDAIVIYRLVRAPERLVFNVDVSNMPTPKAEAYMRKLMNNYWSKKTFNLDENKRVNSFNPQSILDSYWFPKREGGKGTEVSTLPGGGNLDKLADLEHWVKKLYEALKVPTNRVEKDSSLSSDAMVFREELRFANFILRLQQQFAKGIKHAFVTHLKLKNKWDSFELRENAFDLEFTPPRNYHQLRQQQILDLKLNNFNTITQNESISRQYAQKMYLGWTDEMIKANREWLRKDASLQHEIGKIQEGGSNWNAGAGGVPGGGIPMDSETPPEFGPGADNLGNDEPGGEEPNVPPENSQDNLERSTEQPPEQ